MMSDDWVYRVTQRHPRQSLLLPRLRPHILNKLHQLGVTTIALLGPLESPAFLTNRRRHQVNSTHKFNYQNSIQPPKYFLVHPKGTSDMYRGSAEIPQDFCLFLTHYPN